MGGLKEDIGHNIFLKQPKNIVEVMQFSLYIESKNNATHKSSMGAYTRRKHHFGFHKATLAQPTRIS